MAAVNKYKEEYKMHESTKRSFCTHNISPVRTLPSWMHAEHSLAAKTHQLTPHCCLSSVPKPSPIYQESSEEKWCTPSGIIRKLSRLPKIKSILQWNINVLLKNVIRSYQTQCHPHMQECQSTIKRQALITPHLIVAYLWDPKPSPIYVPRFNWKEEVRPK